MLVFTHESYRVRQSTEKQADFGVSLGYRMAADGLHLEADPAEQGMMFEPTASKIYRHPSFYEVPEEVGHM